MSLKAKLEAVIYAAEEPVTLAQLAALFAADAFEWKAAQEAARGEQAEADAQAEPLPFLNQEADVDANAGVEPAAQFSEAEGPLEIPVEIPVVAGAPEASAADSPEAAAAEQVSDEPLSGDSAPAASGESESDLKREARQRDREVRAILRQILDELIAEYAADSRGVEVREIAGGYRMGTKPECHDAVRLFVKSLKPALKLSLPALETLAVIAYKQPVTAPEVNEIRGVDSSGVFGSLLARKLIATAGRKQVIGRPILYKTTKEFLLRFGLKDVNELPSMEEFEKMAAIELEETEAAETEAAETGASETEIAETAGVITEIGEPEPVAPEDSREVIAGELEQELHPELNPEPKPEAGPETDQEPDQALDEAEKAAP